MVELLLGGWLSQAVHAAVKLGIADLLDGQPMAPEAMARAVEADAAAIRRLLRALSQHGVFAETRDGHFAHTPLSRTLRRDGARGSLRGFALYVGDGAHRAHWSDLDVAVRTGKSSVARQRAMPFFSLVQRDAAFGNTFTEAMTSLSDLAKEAILHAYDFGRFACIVDVGGGHGRLLGSILARNADARGVLFDLPEITAGAEPELCAWGVRSRCDVACGSFLEEVPRGGDAYVLKHVLHDWDDAHAQRILRNVRAAIAPGGTLLIIEGVVPAGPAPHLTKLVDLEMLVSVDGKERTEAEFRALLRDAGFLLRRIVQTAAPLSVLEAIPIERGDRHPRDD